MQRTAPQVHLFGHVHEQRGHWHRGDKGFEGGVEYSPHGNSWETFAPPPPTYPCQLIACTAMASNKELDGGKPAHIAGPARLILAHGRPGAWSFRIA